METTGDLSTADAAAATVSHGTPDALGLGSKNITTNTFDEQGRFLDRFWARNLIGMYKKQVPN